MGVTVNDIISVFKWVYQFVKPYKKWIAVNIFATVAAVVCDVYGVYLIKRMLDAVIGKNYLLLLQIIAIVAVIIVAGFFAKYLITYSGGQFGINGVRDMRYKIVKHIGEVSVSNMEKYHTGDIVSRLTNDVSSVEINLINQFSNFLYVPLIVIVSFVYLLLINWRLLLVSFISTPVAIYIANRLSIPMYAFGRRYQEGMSKANSIVQDTIKGIDILKSYKLEKLLYERYKKVADDIYDVDLKVARQQSFILPINVIMYELPYILSAVYGCYLSVKGFLEPSNLVAFIQLMHFLNIYTIQLPYNLIFIRKGSVSVKRLQEIFDLPLERKDGSVYHDDAEKAIEFSNVKFCYEPSKIILDNLSFAVYKGEIVALVGPSGCGKSTVINLICNFYEINSGSIKIFDKDMRDWKLADLRKNISLVLQDTYLFPGTIEDNIKYGKPDASVDEVINAAKIANAHEFIMAMPDKYKTVVGENGVRLSGGERQRIAIARAVLKDSPILLLDEPTASLDTQSEALVQEALERIVAGRTVLVVAHRFSTITQADRILVLNDGRIVEAGTHEQLMGLKGLYYQLYIRQLRDNYEGNYRIGGGEAYA